MGSKAIIPMSQVLWHVKNPEKYERYILSAKFDVLSRQVSPDLLLGVSASICQRALVDESGMIITQIGTYNISENGRSPWYALYDTTP
jgi:hypothetical protein